MKHNKHNGNRKGPGPELVPVHFEFTHPTAASVCIAGTFNDWQPESKAMHTSRAGHWWKETALAPGTYEYCFVVDGRWIPDPRATESVPNPFGGRNSIVRVAQPPAAPQLAETERPDSKHTNKRNALTL